MGNVTASYIRVDPSYVMPDILMQYNQASGAYEVLGGNAPQVRLAEGDLYAYIKKLDIRTKVAAGQSAYNSLPSVTVVANMISTPTYLTRVRAEYDHHDTAAMNNWGASIVEAQRLGMRQGTFQQMRNALLYGFNPTQGEGLLNTAGATSVNLPADSNGNTTLLTYDNGQLAIFLLAQIQAIKTRCMQMGIPVNITILGPQRILGAMEYQNIVQVTQFQRVGAGTATTAGTVNAIVEENKDSIVWAYDDTLIGKGNGGNDAVMIVVTALQSPRENPIDTNAFAALAPNLAATTLQLCDMAAPREIPTPLPGGAIDVLSELRITSGWGVRPEAITILSIQYQ
jgi:hypothetical protein